MKHQLDALMQARNLAALIVDSGEGYCDIRDYLSNGASAGAGILFKVRGHDPIIVTGGMELDEARKSGLRVYTTAEMGYFDLMRVSPQGLQARFWAQCLKRLGVLNGRVGLYGRMPTQTLVALLRYADAHLADYTFVGDDAATGLFDAVYMTKDAPEITRILRVAEATNTVMQATWDFIASHRADAAGQVVDAAGVPLTIGAVKQFVRRALMDAGLEDTDMIFAQGRDAGYPHSRGEEAEALHVGRSIVFDLFPRELGGGYHHDMTRTWCLGYAPPEVERAYAQVMEAFDRSIETYGLGKPTHLLQEAVLDYFEAEGHDTARSKPGTMQGYVHSLGHGVGLNIHERPRITHTRRDDVFQAGNFITIEPGLYYPEQGFGVRIEDSFLIMPDGELRSITPFKKDLVLPLKG